MAVFIVPDTNVFLQARALGELPWHEVVGVQDVIVVVPRAVQKEISRLKSDGSGRRARRARKASALLLSAAQAPGQVLTLRTTNPNVAIHLPRPSPAFAVEGLDPNHPDDQIIAEVIAFRNAFPGDDVRLMTGDSDQVVNANHFGIPFLITPNHWYLPPEPDERDKRITALEREITLLKTTEPTVVISGRDNNDVTVQHFTIESVQYAPLPEDVITALVAQAQERSPRREGLERLVGQQRPHNPIEMLVLAADPFQNYQAPTTEDVTKYEEQYAAWPARLRHYLARLHYDLGAPSRYATGSILLQNSGKRPADGVVLSITIGGGLQLAAKAPNPELDFPRPPQPPTGHFASRRPLIHDSLRPYGVDPWFTQPQSTAPNRDPNKFYKEYGDKPCKVWDLNCDEFRHGTEERRIVGIVIPEDWQGTGAAITVTVSARNMSAPTTTTIPIIVTKTTADTVATARSILDKHLKSKITVQIAPKQD